MARHVFVPVAKPTKLPKKAVISKDWPANPHASTRLKAGDDGKKLFHDANFKFRIFAFSEEYEADA